LAKEAEEMPLLTNFFMVSYTFAWVHDLLTHLQKEPKWPRYPSPDLYQLSDSELPADGELDICGLDENPMTNIDLFDFCYAEVEKELGGQTELIGEDEADALYGVSTNPSSEAPRVD
jgi:hypothetical protein